MSLQYGIKEVLDITAYDYATNNPLFYIDYAQTTEIDNQGQRVFLDGGKGAMRLLSFDYQKVSQMKLKVPLVDMNFLAMLMGDSINTATQNILKREVLTVSSGTATLSATPVAGTTTSVFYLNGLRDFGTAFTTAATPTAGQYNISNGNTLNFNSADNGKQVVVTYTYATAASTTKFSLQTTTFVKPVKLVGTGLFRDQQTGQDKSGVITIYNARFGTNFNFVMSTNQPTDLDITIDMYSYNNGTSYIYYDFVVLT